MKKLLIGLSVLIVLLLSGCATSSAPSPKISSQGEAQEKLSNEAAKYKKSCDMNDANACTKLGNMYAYGNKDLKKNNVITKKYLTKACDLNDGAGCCSLASYYGREEKNNSKSKKYYKKACDLNAGCGWFGLGLNTMSEARSVQDFLKAKEYYKKSCDLKHGMGCYMYEHSHVK